MLTYEWGGVFVASLAFQTYNPTTGNWENGPSMWAEPDFARPYPFWFYPTPASSTPTAVTHEKVDFLPAPGIRVTTALGQVYYWIKDNILYWLRAEYGPSAAEAQALAISLSPL